MKVVIKDFTDEMSMNEWLQSNSINIRDGEIKIINIETNSNNDTAFRVIYEEVQKSSSVGWGSTLLGGTIFMIVMLWLMLR